MESQASYIIEAKFNFLAKKLESFILYFVNLYLLISYAQKKTANGKNTEHQKDSTYVTCLRYVHFIS